MSSRADGRVIAAAGGVVWRPADGGGHGGQGGAIEIAVVHRPRYDDWSLPKGKLDAGEHALQAAVREVCEETGLEVVAGRRAPTTGYAVDDVPKRVDYWLMRWIGGSFVANDECDELRWLPPDDAAALVTHDHDRLVIADAARPDLPREVTVLLVRHGRAGSKQEFDGPDDLRPLDGKGRRQAQRLAEVLPHFSPDAVASAPPLRCRQTVQPLAQLIGVGVHDLPELGEEGFSDDPQRGLTAIERLMVPRADAGVTVVCSQGGAMPSVLQALGVHGHGVTGLLPPAAKGSVWALGGRPGALVADYYRDLDPDPDARP
ncbi:NUDIX hydrolase [Blastococcus goldschmidtiae]|uniref:Bifunctional NUDIX hydrolase/histidine phosphatase family protein n=1 Tax=Blastococcus goldschmidtiae TaxID=3075546 RepID=A0ABU2KAR1_9ACTN|nr:bifunctional NUDIX hydrolase/histidine phosphatase family protein [Blastococcus sp. DSM 46792]MDT0277253.1 bifunctional NUDIX hydrolase/histidine phosphatase family protein [Blastococcus sp. DSM 46792]